MTPQAEIVAIDAIIAEQHTNTRQKHNTARTWHR